VLGVSEVTFTTEPFHTYQVELSADLSEWNDYGGLWYGDGTEGAAIFAVDTDRMFYRVRETTGTFLTVPLEGQQIARTDGVAFAFNMDGFVALPAKIRIYQRPWNINAAWTQIGQVTDFTQRDGLQSVRGSVVWLVPTDGEYEVKAEAVNASGAVLITNQRHIIVGQGTPPTISFISGPSTTSAVPVEAVFEVATSPLGAVRRVEFYDNGVLMGEDKVSPFGDELLDKNLDQYKLLRGPHNITAKAYNASSVVGVTATPYVVQVTGGNARPVLTVTSPANGAIINQGTVFWVSCSTSDPDGNGTVSELYGEDTFDATNYDVDYSGGPLGFETNDWEPGSHVLRLSCYDSSGSESYYRYLTVYIRTGSGSTFAQTLAANITDSASATIIATTASKPVFTGAQASSQEFSDGTASGLQMNSGILLTTGKAEIWNDGDGLETGNDHDPNHPSEESDWIWGTPGDSRLLDRVGSLRTADAAALEFEVFCPNGQLELEYQFGSEEYDEYVNSFNDGFLVLVNDVIVSLLPDASDIVSVNSINLNSRRELFLGDVEDINATVTEANQAVQVEYDGMTIRLKIHALVTPGQTHRVRVVVADTKDWEYDSALFIKQGSLRTISPQP
jgi:hypothetical protein